MVTFMRSCIFKIRGTWCHLDSHCECLVYTTSMFNTPNKSLEYLSLNYLTIFSRKYNLSVKQFINPLADDVRRYMLMCDFFIETDLYTFCPC